MNTPWGFPDFDAHEALHFVTDEKSGLRAIIAMHSTHLGPAAGGTRLWHYADDGEAARDRVVPFPFAAGEAVMDGAPAGIADPVVDDDRVDAALGEGIPLRVAGVEIADDGEERAVVVQQRALRVLALAVRGIGKRLSDEAVGKCDAMRGVRTPVLHRLAFEARPGRGEVFVGRPHKRAVVDDDVGRAKRGETVFNREFEVQPGQPREIEVLTTVY